jgi:L-ascorbate metabolism protein UlaG (beta-lactamase superfamily)
MKHLLILILTLPYLISEVSAGEPSQVHYLANEGVMVQHGDTRILFDPLFRNGYGHYELVPEDMEKALFDGVPPWDGIDAVFVSHYHGDHFSPEVMLNFLKAREEIRFYGPAQATEALRAAAKPEDAALFDRVTAIDLAYGQAPVTLAMEGLNIEAVRIPHSGWPEGRTEVQNIVFRVTLDELTTVVHMGDADANDVHFERDAAYWASRPTGMAFPPYWFFLSDEGRRILDERIRAKASIGVHVPEKMPDDAAERPAELDGIDLFTKPGETREIQPADR